MKAKCFISSKCGGVLFVGNKRIYTINGELVVKTAQLIFGQSYVAANKEKFKKCGYLIPHDFNLSIRLKRKS